MGTQAPYGVVEMKIQDRLRSKCTTIRRDSSPIANVIPLMQEAADKIQALEADKQRLLNRVQELERKLSQPRSYQLDIT